MKGKYADFLLNAWDEWDEDESSDNDRPGDEIVSHDPTMRMYYT